MSVAVIYDFFPHYRLPVLRALQTSGRFDYAFFGAARSLRGGIEAVGRDDLREFTPLWSKYIRGFLLQPGAISLVFRKDVEALVFLANPYFLSTWVAAACARLMRKKVFFWTHGWLNDRPGPKERIRDRFYRLADALLLYGERAKAIGQARGFDPRRMFVIHNSLDFDEQQRIRAGVSRADLQQVRDHFFAGSESPFVVCSARLTNECRFDLLIDALAMLKEGGVEVHALLIGEGPERVRLENAAANRDVRVAFAGACYDQEQLARMICGAKATVSPGKVGLTAMQSLAFGVPVISHGNLNFQMPEIEAIIPSVNGDFFDYQDAASLAAVIRRWVDYTAPDLAERCVESLVPDFTPAGQVRAIEDALESMGLIPPSRRERTS